MIGLLRGGWQGRDRIHLEGTADLDAGQLAVDEVGLPDVPAGRERRGELALPEVRDQAAVADLDRLEPCRTTDEDELVRQRRWPRGRLRASAEEERDGDRRQAEGRPSAQRFVASSTGSGSRTLTSA